jgi:hypothetical protein
MANRSIFSASPKLTAFGPNQLAKSRAQRELCGRPKAASLWLMVQLVVREDASIGKPSSGTGSSRRDRKGSASSSVPRCGLKEIMDDPDQVDDDSWIAPQSQSERRAGDPGADRVAFRK